MIYACAVQQHKHDCYMRTDKDTFASIRKIYKKVDSTTSQLLPQFQTVTGFDTVNYFFNVSKRVVSEGASSGIKPFNMTVELGSSNITTESVNNEVKKLKKNIQKYFYRGKEVEGLEFVETRMRQYNEIKTKTKQI